MRTLHPFLIFLCVHLSARNNTIKPGRKNRRSLMKELISTIFRFMKQIDIYVYDIKILFQKFASRVYNTGKQLCFLGIFDTKPNQTYYIYIWDSPLNTNTKPKQNYIICDDKMNFHILESQRFNLFAILRFYLLFAKPKVVHY